MKRLIAILPLLLLVSACDQGAPSADPSEITARSEIWETALNAGDLDTLVARYTSDARILAPNEKAASGADAVRAAFGAMIDAGLNGSLTSIDAAVSGDIGYNVGNYTLTAEGEVVDAGKYVETWQRGADGEWRITNDIWNSDMPAAPAAMPMGDGPKTHLMITHEVDDVERWLSAWRGDDSRHALFKANGAAHVHTFTTADNPNLAGLVIAVKDMDALNAMLGSEAGIAAAAEDGVRADTLTVLTQAD
jgi:ketosteroid isomerase-like protein